LQQEHALTLFLRQEWYAMVLIQLYGQIKNILELKLLMLLVSNNVKIEAGVNTLLMVSLVQV